MNKLQTTLLIASVGILTFAGSVNAQTRVKLASVAPQGTPWADVMYAIQKRINSESGGKYNVKVYPGGQLGGENEILAGVRGGRIEFAGLTTGAVANVVPELNVLEMPYLFDNIGQADCVLDNHLIEPVSGLLTSKGMVFISWAENGFRSIGMKGKAIKVPADLSGVKVRSQEAKTHIQFWKSVGASPIPIAIPEVLPALQTGVVTAFDNTPLFTMAAEWQTTIDNFTFTKHIYQPALIVVSKSFHDKQPAENRSIIVGKTNELAGEVRKGVRALDGRLVATLKKTGVAIHNPSAAELAQWKAASAGQEKTVLPKLGGKSKAIYDAVIKGKSACK
ncbi:TRAP transporter substrate-binding protein [Leptospira sp. GIMC2001]|uniref:TRAP transporter substrate-binding protein n=1 Tax=Leptospira sp. GIMC2001 TaxID=1513297 RepID=UPI00234BC33B|nr:TRAP transporter substrate-binding protein DctP [Leptospira sp. GIMC2001]WCL49905.1 TRAP transporter substrate-binding protein DctP [Leptospira sp. GIMC2001]